MVLCPVGDWGSWLASKPGSYNIGGPCKTAGWRCDVQLPGAIDFSLHMKQILMTLPWSSLAPDGADSARIVSGTTNSSAPLYAAHTLGAVGAGGPVVVVYVRAAQAFSLHAAGTGGEVEVRYFDPSGGEQARSTAFPVLGKVLKGGGGVLIEVPAQPWAGDGVVVLQRVVTTTTVPLMSDDAQACRGQQQRPLKSDDDDGAGAGADNLWPLPESVQCTAGGLPLVAGFKVRTSSPSAVAIAAAQRYTEFFAPAPLSLDVPTHGTGAGTRTLSGVALVVSNASEALGVETQYGFNLALTSTGSELTATVSSPYAAVSALETIGQLLSGCTARFGCSTFNCTELALSDAPMFRHRGLMIDAGRRHYPLPLVKDLLEGMAMSRLNVLHLHFADYGNSEFEQFGAGGIRIESKRHPQLTAGLEDTAGTRLHYTQEEVRTIVAFAKLRGIRVVPELEQTGHASYLWPLAGPPHHLEFCSENTEDKTGAQVFNDPAGRAKTVLTSLVEEYSGLFPDAVFHVGSDKTAYVGNCTKVNTYELEREVVAKVVSLGKKPMLWWAPATSLQVAKPGETIVNAWTHSHGAGTLPGYSAVQATAAGYEAVESAGGQFYLDHPKGKGWADLSSYWFDITRGQTLTAKQQELLLGGEVSMWNNPWCLWGECHSTKGERFCGWWMSGMDPLYDAEYALSVQGAVWPKAAVAARAFYRHNSSLPVAELTRRVGAFTAAMVRRGLRSCACSVFDGAGGGCTPAARCGVPYANRNASGAPVETCKSDDTDGLQLAALGLGAAGTSTIRVRVAPGPGDTAAGRGAGAVGAVTDAASALHNFSLDGGGGGGGGGGAAAHNAGLLDHNASYALADTARFARASWDCGAWGTQGAVITEKILSLGGPSHLALARRWLLNTPVLGDTGEAFSTEGQQYHTGADGKWEANAELILSAALFAKHAGQHQIFAAPVSRLVCAVHANGSRRLITRGGNLSTRLCGDAAGGLEAHDPSLFATTMNAAFHAGTEGRSTVNASGTALFQNLTAPEGFVGLSLPLRQYKPLPKGMSCWPLTALVFKMAPASMQQQQQQLIHRQQVEVSSTAAWVDLAVTAAAGRYRIELWPAVNVTTREDGIFTSAAWVSHAPTAAGRAGSNSSSSPSVGGGGGSMTFAPGAAAHPQWSERVPVPATLGARLAKAMRWQLSFARASEGESVGIMTIPDANWRGVGRDDVGASSAMWDLIRSGYKDTWLNVRFIQSIEAMLQLQDGGLVDETVVTMSDLKSAKDSFHRTFSADLIQQPAAGGFVSWIGCGRVTHDDRGVAKSDCAGAEGVAHQIPVSIGFVPALAAAVMLDVAGEGAAAALKRFDPVRNAARNVSGRFKTNTVPIESVNVTLWRASSRWKQRDHEGYARRVNGSGGDWQIFNPAVGASDGYGQFGYTEENGGIVLSTTALVFEAGVYPEMFADFVAIVDAVTRMVDQLDEGVAGVAEPLLATKRGYLRIPIAAGSVPQELCKAARRLPDSRHPPDRWGERWCSYYKSVSWNLPGAGAFVYAFAKGLLQLELPTVQSGTDVSVSVWGTTVGRGMQQRVELPAWSIPRWPTELLPGFSIDVVGLNIGGVAYTLECDTWCDLLALGERKSKHDLCCTLS